MKNGTGQRKGIKAKKESHVSIKGEEGALQYEGTLWL
jgi:hypothetical protein